jgi:hypothetical protein
MDANRSNERATKISADLAENSKYEKKFEEHFAFQQWSKCVVRCGLLKNFVSYRCATIKETARDR